jgi:hypothetical protein
VKVRRKNLFLHEYQLHAHAKGKAVIAWMIIREMRTAWVSGMN